MKWKVFGLTILCPVFLSVFTAMDAVSAAGYPQSNTYYVSIKTGSDDNPGTSRDKPLKTIKAGIRKLRTNDTLVIGPGDYYIPPQGQMIEDISNCWIVAKPRGKALITGAWKEAYEGTVKWKEEGNGFYSAEGPPHPQMSGHVTIDGTGYYLPFLNALRKSGFERNNVFFKVPPYGFTFDRDTKKLSVRLPGNADPTGRPIVIQNHRSKLFVLHNTKNVVIDGLTFRGVIAGISATENNDGLLIRNCKFEHCRGGIRLENADDTVIEWCEYTFNDMERWMTEVFNLNSDLGDLKNGAVRFKHHIPYHYGKGFFNNEHGLARVENLVNHESRFNYSHGVMDGFNWYGCNDSSFHHNVASYIFDNAWETDHIDQGWGKNMRIHHNLLLQCMTVPISQQYGNGKAKREGPVFVYRNVAIGYDYYGWKGSVIKGVGTIWENGYNVFHNTFWVKNGGLASLVNDQTSRKAQHSAWYVNNLLIFENDFNFRYEEGFPKRQMTHNIVVTKNGEKVKPLFLKNGGKHLRSMEEIKLKTKDMGISPDDGDRANDRIDFSLTKQSPCVNTGKVLPESWPNDGRNYTGKSPDIGAVEYGERVDSYGVPYDSNWPRPRKTVYDETPPEGFRDVDGW